EKNALRLAQQQPVEKPFYMVGRLGGQDLTIGAGGGGRRVQGGDEKPQTLNRGSREVGDETEKAANRIAQAEKQDDEAGTDDDGQGATTGPQAPRLEEGWQEAIHSLDATEGDESSDEHDEPFDPDSGWHGRAMIWERKQTGENAGLSEPEDEKEEDLR